MTGRGTGRPDYLTVRELADLLRLKDRKVYDLAATGQVPCTRVTGKLLFPEAEIRAWLARGYTPGRAAEPHRLRRDLCLGSHDPLLDWTLRESRAGIASYCDGSTDGLDRFVAGEGTVAGLHLQDAETGDWNVSAVAARCSGADAVLVHFAWRARGLVAAPGLGLTNLSEIAGRTVVPRQPGSGTAVLFETLLRQAGLAPTDMHLTSPAQSEVDAVLSVAQGAAEVTLGLAPLAQQYGLSFVPLLNERFDLLIDRKAWFDPPVQTFLAFCNSRTFRDRAADGYDISELGRVLWNA
ncbi:MAG: helix-turn-helix transcriptional regulator [Pseudomonadota bacterium]